MFKPVTQHIHKIEKGEKATMTDKLSPARKVFRIIDSTKSLSLNWINLSKLKDYLRSRDLSLAEIPLLHSFLIYLQSERFIFDCTETYVTFFQNEIIIFSKSKYSFGYRLDSFTINLSNSKWQRININLSLLLRLRNAIVVTDNSEDNIEGFLHTISANSLA